MDKTSVLQPDELMKEVAKQGGAIAGLLNNQWTTLQLLDGTLLMSFGMHSQLFAAMLGELALQNSFASAQLGEQQLYDAAALEGASAMYLLTSTLSGNVDRMTGYLLRMMNFSETTNESIGQVLPLLKEMRESSGINDAANTAFGGIGAMSSVGDAIQKSNIGGVGTALKTFGGAAGIMGKLGALAPLLTSAAPLLVGGLAVAGIGTIAYKAYKNHKAKKEEEKKEEEARTNVANPLTGVEDEVDTGQARAQVQVDTTQALVDPFNTGQGEDSAYNKYQGQIESSQKTADTLREAVRTGNIDVAAQLGAVADALQRLAEKPADRNVKSEIVINTLKTNTTLSEFKEMFIETLVRDLETVE
ncbi:hypothetical protein ACS3UN_10345 [Oscillospiraceae bacterium LTW-04]|nr:hypothetical protein RBH76_12095 [Oscillospiraceae bacterium MB24-C1]